MILNSKSWFIFISAILFCILGTSQSFPTVKVVNCPTETSFSPTANACNLTVNAGPDITICLGKGKVLNANVSSATQATYEWEPPDGLDDPTKLKPIANPMATTTYTLTARAVSQELIVNGGMEGGGIAPSTSSYTPVAGLAIVTSSSSNYAVLSYPQISGAFGCQTRGAASMVIHGSGGVGQNFWCQTVAVTPNRDYKYEYWVMSVVNFFFTPVITMKINGNTVSSLSTSGICSWDDASGIWNSGAATSATICFSNATSGGQGNMAAFDDVSFKECCEEKDEVTVTVYEIVADIADPDEIGCNNRPLELDGSGSTSGTGISYEWTTTNGKIIGSTNSNKVKVDAPGTYKLTVKGLHGCEAEKEVIVTGNVKPPVIQTKSTPINCKLNYGFIEVIGAGQLSYDWRGPNDFMGNSVKEKVYEAGQYTITVTDEYGCTATSIVEVRDQRIPIDLLILGDTITCLKDSVTLRSKTARSNLNYTWKYKGSTISIQDKTSAKDTGWYYLTVKDSIDCIAIDSFFVLDFKKNLPISLSADTLNCINSKVQIKLKSDTSGTVRWNGPNNFTSTQKQVSVQDSGWYYVNILTKDGCIGFDSVYVTKDVSIPDLGLNSIDTLTCMKTSVLMTATSSTNGVRFEWKYPSGKLVDSLSITVQDSGWYTVRVISKNGCDNQKQIYVAQKLDKPQVSLFNDTLNCLKKSIRLSYVGKGLVQFQWSGPNGFASTDSNAVVDVPGKYILKVFDAFGCSNENSVDISIDTTLPNIQIEIDTLTCSKADVYPLIIGDTVGNSFTWYFNGQLYSSNPQSRISSAGNYTIEIQGKNYCQTTITKVVVENKIKPLADLYADTIQCNGTAFIEAVNKQGVSNFSWTGPSNFQSKDLKTGVDITGWYYFTQTGLNGCVGLDSIFVYQKDKVPSIIAKDDTLTCQKKKIILNASSNSNNVKYSWTGPNGFMSNLQQPEVVDSGIYILRVEDPNGCVATKAIRISKFDFEPEVFIISGDSAISCLKSSLQLGYSSQSNNNTILWQGPNAYSSTNNNVVITEPGLYRIELKNEFGCTAFAEKTILDKRALPKFEAVDDTITCKKLIVQNVLRLQDNTNQVIWTGPNGFNSTQQNPTIYEAGVYKVVVQNEYGCKDSIEIKVIENTDEPVIKIQGDSLTCTKSEASLIALIGNGNFQCNWSGPNNYTSLNKTITVNKGGLYACMVTDTINGCSSFDVFELVEDTNRIREIGLVVDDELCNNKSGRICFCKVEGGHSPYKFSIDSGKVFLSQNDFSALKSGKYVVIAKDQNDCIFQQEVIISNSGGITVTMPSELNLKISESSQLTFTSSRPVSEIKSILWSPSDQLSCSDCISPTLIAQKNQTIELLVIDVDGCESRTLIEIKVLNSEEELYFPNVISANFDTTNDYFFPKSKSEVTIDQMTIYDRWGELVFSSTNFTSNNEKAGWNGTIRGQTVNPGVYLYLLNYTIKGVKKQSFGEITVLR